MILSAHDISSGGLITALSEMAINSLMGVKVSKPKKLTNFTEYLFGEDQGRYVIEVDKKGQKDVEKILKLNDIFYEIIGFTQKKYFEIEGEMKIDINDLFKVNNQWYNNY